MKIELNIKPISINRAYQGRRYKTPEYKIWREEMAWLLKGYKPVVKDKYEIEIEWWSPNANQSDCDNPTKCIIDAIVEAKIIKDDRHIDTLSVKKFKGDYKIIINIK